VLKELKARAVVNSSYAEHKKYLINKKNAKIAYSSGELLVGLKCVLSMLTVEPCDITAGKYLKVFTGKLKKDSRLRKSFAAALYKRAVQSESDAYAEYSYYKYLYLYFPEYKTDIVKKKYTGSLCYLVHDKQINNSVKQYLSKIKKVYYNEKNTKRGFGMINTLISKYPMYLSAYLVYNDMFQMM
jgi:hypothetical protein